MKGTAARKEEGAAYIRRNGGPAQVVALAEQSGWLLTDRSDYAIAGGSVPGPSQFDAPRQPASQVRSDTQSGAEGSQRMSAASQPATAGGADNDMSWGQKGIPRMR